MSKIITFFGGDTQVGTTMIAQSVAEILANKYDKKVLLILASSNIGIDYMNKETDKNFDDIRLNLFENTLTKAEVQDTICTYGKIDFIPPITDTTTIKYYSINTINTIRNLMEDDYELFIVDGGSNLNNPLSISSLKDADERYYVVTQSYKCLNRYLYINRKILSPLNYTGDVIVNRYVNQSFAYNIKDILNILEKEEVLSIAMSNDGNLAEATNDTLISDNVFLRDINKLVDKINQSDDKEGNEGLYNE